MVQLAKASTLALVSMAVIVVTVVIQGALAPAESKGSVNTFNLLVINDGIFQAIGVISFGMGLAVSWCYIVANGNLKHSCVITTRCSSMARSKHRRLTASRR